MLKLYRLLISPVLHAICGPNYGCRFIPTCSEYASEACHQYGYWNGFILAAKRLLRCHPFARAGYDPVPHGIGTRVTQNKNNQDRDLIREGRPNGA